MKRISLLLLSLIVFTNCSIDDSESLRIENVTIFIDNLGVDNCKYILKTEQNEYFTTDSLPDEYSENTFKAQISFIVTEESGNCGFGGPLIKINILKLVKL